MEGKEVLKKNYQNTTDINTTSIKSGIYMLIVFNGHSYSAKKILIK